jgi:hypothetical protein
MITTLEQCDSCTSAAAAVRWTKVGQELVLCGHHSTQSGPGLLANGFTPTPIGEGDQ